MTTNRMVIVGAGVAGHAVADELRDQQFTGEIVLVNGEVETPYDRPPLSKTHPGSQDGRLVPIRETKWARERGITMLTGAAARSLNSGRRELRLTDGQDLAFNGLAICTGVHARRLPLPLDRAGVHVLRTAADAGSLYSSLRSSRRVVVIGAGLLGMELAASMRRMGLEVTVVCRSASPLHSVLGHAASRWFADLHDRNGVHLRRGVETEALFGAPSDWRVVLSDGETVEADLVVATVGSEPTARWLIGSEVDVDDGVLCNEYCETTMDTVVTAGDVARRFDPRTQLWERSEHWTNAVETGRVAARSLLGDRIPYAAVPYFWTDQFSAAGRFAGRMGDREDVVQSSEDRLVVEYSQGGQLCGVFTVNAPRDFLLRRRQLGLRPSQR